MSAENEQLVTEFCNALGGGDMGKVVSYLSADVFYHNMPWAPVTGHAGVREVLDPFVGANLLQKMEITHTASSGDVVTNERLETWVKGRRSCPAACPRRLYHHRRQNHHMVRLF